MVAKDEYTFDNVRSTFEYNQTHLKKGTLALPNGSVLYWEENEVGGRRYHSDEVGGGVVVWDTALVDSATLLAAIAQEQALLTAERHQREKQMAEEIWDNPL